MAWWDYGYQISGMAERTTIADGNTWNIEHIGMLGLTLTYHNISFIITHRSLWAATN